MKKEVCQTARNKHYGSLTSKMLYLRDVRVLMYVRTSWRKGRAYDRLARNGV